MSLDASSSFVLGRSPFRFTWDLASDQATLRREQAEHDIWRGSLLPLFWIAHGSETFHACKATVLPAESRLTSAGGTVALNLPGHGRAQLELTVDEDGGGLRFTALTVTWRSDRPAPALHSFYFGADVMTPAQRRSAPSLERPFWPNWRAEGFGLPSAKTAPMQSFFRCWDFGHANLPLGSFGPAMGAPYAAAFPRPTYGAGAGGRHGWIFFEIGGPADGALTFQVRSCSGAIEWRCREDLWGAPPDLTRSWEHPLHVRWADTLWLACRDAYRAYPRPAAPTADHQKTFWGTWGDFKIGLYDVPATADRGIDEMAADLVCIDDPWESHKGSCRPDRRILPNFEADLAYARGRGLGIGIWMPTGWIGDPGAVGLGPDDLLLNIDGYPIRSNWALDPHEGDRAACCLDPSSPRTRAYLRERTHRVMRDYRPSLLKLDFGYGLPGPDGCAPRDPAFRGERLALTLSRIIADAAREIDPDVTLLGYALHPLWHAAQDQLSMDDLGDSGATEAHGHRHWSIWAALAGDHGLAIMGSSGYDWAADDDVLLDTIVLGAPGANLPRKLADGSPVPPAQLARRRLLMQSHRPARRWEPWWLDSAPGAIGAEPEVRSWGRIEYLPDGSSALTALALRDPLRGIDTRGVRWQGRWAVVSGSDEDIFNAPEITAVPFDSGWLELPRPVRPARVTCVERQKETAHVDWTWHDGLLRIEAPDTSAAGSAFRISSAD